MDREIMRRPAIDVTGLPGSDFDSQSPLWWGNFLFMTIETMTIALLITSYFYVAQNFEQWPPPSVNRVVPIYDPNPDLLYGSLGVALLVAATPFMVWADGAARKLRKGPVLVGLTAATLAGVAALILRYFELPEVKFKWDENAYASIVWTLLILHWTYLFLEVGEAGVNVFWILLHGLDEKHAVDVSLSTAYWYWTAGIGVIIYVVVYWAPRFL
jgi:cytochrome c oxidase subunit III